MKKIEKKCFCGNIVKYKSRTFCSIQCSNKAKWNNREKFHGTYKNCVICNNEFLITKKTRVAKRKTCSFICKQKLAGKAGAAAVHKKYNDSFLKEIEILERKREEGFQKKFEENIKLENDAIKLAKEIKSFNIKNREKRKLKDNSVSLICKFCHTNFFVAFKARDKRKFCTLVCYRKSLSGSGNPAYDKVYRTKLDNPEWAENIKNGLIKAGVNVGDKNAMKRPEVAFKMSQTRSKMLQNNQAMRKEMSNRAKELWASGRMEGVSVGRCKWYEVHCGNEIYKAQGTWERDFIKWMFKNNIKFRCHRSKFDYQDDEGEWHRYFPDFYVESWNTFVDIKSEYIECLNRRKLELVREYNKNIELTLVKKDFIDLIRKDLKNE